MRRSAILLALLLGLAVAQTDRLELAVDQSPVGLDPHVVTAFSSINVLDQIYETLLEINPQLQLQPALAESYQVSDDGLTYTFDLQDDAVFHNGRPLTAEDVVYSFERIMAEETGSPHASRFSQVASAAAIDEDTVEFRLAEPFAPFLSNLPYLHVVAREAAEAEGGLQQNAIGTGPFRLVEVVPDTYVDLEAHPEYWREGQPLAGSVRFNVVPEASTRAAGLRTGTYHLVPDLDPTTAETLRGTPSVQLLETQDLGYSLLGLNVQREPFDDPRVRRAINLAIDRGEIVDAVYLGNAVPGGPLSPALSDWALPASEYACYADDREAALAEARQLLAEAGYEDGFETEILTFGTIPVVADLAQVLQAQLAEVGIDAELNVAEFGTFVQDWRNSNFDMFVSLNGGALDPDAYLYRTFHTGGSTNVFGYSDPEVDALLDEGRTTVDPEARREIYDQLQAMLACEGPIAHVAYATLFSATSEGVSGFQQVPSRDLHYLRETSVE